MRAIVIVCASAVSVDAQEFFTLKGHGGPVMDIAVSRDGQIATASFDNAVGLWANGAPTWFDGHEAAVNVVAFWDAETLISGGDDYKVRQWSEQAGNVVLGEHRAKVMGLDVSAEVGLVASASWDGTVGLWPFPTNDAAAPVSLRGHKLGVNDVAFSDDGLTIYSASTDGTIRVWDTQTGEQTQLLANHGFGVNELVLNEADGWLAYGAVDGGTRIIDLATGTEIEDFTLDRRPILALAYDPIEHHLAVGDGDGYIMVVDTTEMRISRDFRATQNGPIWALAFSPDGANIHASGIEDIVYSWPVATIDEYDQMAGTEQSFLRDPETMDNGERQFKRKCSICHTLTEGSARRAGPSLHNLFGRPAGTLSDYTYSETLNGSDIVWSDDTIDALFAQGPDHYIPGTKMPMQRIAKQEDRTDLINYLRRVGTPREN